MTTLTKQQLLNHIAFRYEEVEVPGWGTVGIRSYDELQRSRRMAYAAEKEAANDDSGVRALRLFAVIDRIMIDMETPYFSDDDLPLLRSSDSHRLDVLADAIAQFDGEDPEGKPTGESTD